MLKDLMVVHRKDGAALNLGQPWIVWKTCLRQLAIGLKSWELPSDLNKADEIKYGIEAYRLCLEIVCGLGSPLTGETQVFGQFRNFFIKLDSEGYFARHDLKRFFENLLEDAKEVRTKHLQNLGGDKYGSLTRFFLKDINTISIIGTGQIVKDILPWILKGEKSINIFYRSKAPAVELKAKYPKVAIHDFSKIMDAPYLGALIVAAPIKASEIEKLSNDKLVLILDLRGEDDPINVSIPQKSLSDFFKESEKNQEKLKDKVIKAQSEISRITHTRSKEIILHPYGWEDIWA